MSISFTIHYSLETPYIKIEFISEKENYKCIQ